MQLADEFGYASSVVERSGDSLVITDFEDSGHQSSGSPGERIRYAPPFGVAFAAWDTEEGQRAWIARAAASNEVLALHLSEVLSRTRERGFDVDCTTPALTQAAHVMGTLSGDGLPDRVRELTDQLLVEFTTIGILVDDRTARQAVATIAAPVFDDRGRVGMIVAVHPLQALTRTRIDAVGRRVAQVASAISGR
jgi:DNA-binding IclR family transcriptional regulator